MGEVNSFSSQIYRGKKQTGAEGRRRKPGTPVNGWQIKIETSNGTELKREDKARLKSRRASDASRQLLARCHSARPPATNSSSNSEDTRIALKFQVRAHKLVAFIRVTSCLFFQINQA